MSNLIDFSELIPPRLKINNLPDGSSLELIRREEMGPEEMAQFQDIQNRIEELEKKQKKTANQQATLTLVEKMNEVMGDAIKMVAPDITAEQLEMLKMGRRLAVIRWWSQVHKDDAAPNGSSPPPQS